MTLQGPCPVLVGPGGPGGPAGPCGPRSPWGPFSAVGPEGIINAPLGIKGR